MMYEISALANASVRNIDECDKHFVRKKALQEAVKSFLKDLFNSFTIFLQAFPFQRNVDKTYILLFTVILLDS